MSAAATWYGMVNEDGSYSILARVTALDGSGQTVADEEGPCLEEADVATITCKAYDLGTDRDAVTGTPISPDPTVVVANAISDVLLTAGWPTTRDYAGYNFRHDLSPTYCPDPNEWVLLEYKFTLTGGTILWLKVRVQTALVVT